MFAILTQQAAESERQNFLRGRCAHEMRRVMRTRRCAHAFLRRQTTTEAAAAHARGISTRPNTRCGVPGSSFLLQCRMARREPSVL